ncbi:MAG: penicillin-binding protein activator [Nitrospirae bacterium]|nr:penicillin-binding protein activator [Nitrospirota bacterium]
MKSLSFRSFRRGVQAAVLACCLALAVFVPVNHPVFGQSRAAVPTAQERAAFAQAQALFAAGELSEAADTLEHFLATYQASGFRGEAKALLGKIRLQQAAYHDAVSILAEVIEQDPDGGYLDQARVDLASAYVGLGRKKPAMVLLETVSTSDAAPALRRQAYDSLIDLVLQEGDVSHAVKLLVDERALPEGVVDPEALDTRLRDVIAQAEDPTPLESVFEEFPARFPGDLALFRAAQLYGSRSETFHQERLLRKFLAAFPTYERTADAKAQLEANRTRLRSSRYVIGLPLPYQGDLQPYATSILRGTQLAIEQGRAGLPDQSLGLAVKDYGGDPARLGAAIDEMIKEYRCIAVLGPLLSREMSVLVPRTQQWKIPLVSPTATGPVNPNRYFFRTALTGSVEGQAIAQYALQRLGMKRFAILSSSDRYSVEAVAAFKDEAVRQGGRIVFSATYDPGAVDFGSEIKRLKESDLLQEGTMATPPEAPNAPDGTVQPLYVPGFDAVFLPGDGETVGLLAAQLAFYDIRVPLLGSSEWNGRDLIKTGGKYVEDGIFADAFFAGSPDPVVQQFVKQFRQRYHDDPDVFAAQAFDAVSLLIQALKAGGTTGERLRDELTKISGYHGVSGISGFGPEGEVLRRLSWVQIKNGRFLPAL